MRTLPLIILLPACSGVPSALPPSASPRTRTSSTPPPASASPTPAAQIAASVVPRCEAFDWAPRALSPLLRPIKPGHFEHAAGGKQPDQAAAEQGAFESECQDAPDGPSERSPTSVTLDGIAFELTSTTLAGKSGRGWLGNQCAFSARLADGSGTAVHLAAPELPPFNSIRAVVRAGSAAFVSVSFNGYSKEFPQGGNRVFALDLCAGRVVWQSANDTSNGGLLLLGDYLIAPYGFTSEPRSLFVLDAHSGTVVQRLPIIENVCPSERWAPNWHRGDPCDPPGQKVGAATNPHVAGGLLLVDTNTGSAAFQFE
ncbi:MAG TPA: hypothetical protein VER11_08810 [Polyangiaceae bacterium]|nr:hypothetical protein [Polyangiaceae bacterium]